MSEIDYTAPDAPSVSSLFFDPAYDTSEPAEYVAEDELDAAGERGLAAGDAADDAEDDYMQAFEAEYADGQGGIDYDLASALSGPEAAEYYRQLGERRAYEDYVDHVEAVEEANADADRLVAESGRRHDVQASAEDGYVRQLAATSSAPRKRRRSAMATRSCCLSCRRRPWLETR